MKKYIFLSLAISIIFSFYGFSIEVCPNCPINIIKEAISLAKNEDTIIVHKGIYKESNIIINKSIHIVGKKKPIIDGDNKSTIFKINANNFSLSGLTIKNVRQSYTKDFAGILVNNSKHFNIINNTFENVFFGILIEKSKNGIVKENNITGAFKDESSAGNGIHLWHCSNMKIVGNTLTNLRDGIYFEFVKNSSISKNISFNNLRYGLHFMFSDRDEYHHNRFENNGAGVAVMFSKNIKIHHNTFIKNWGAASYGLLLKEIYDADIQHNLFEQNTIGINIDGCSRINYLHNNFLRNGWAVSFTGGCYTNIFMFNNFMFNSFDLSYNSKINDNVFAENYWSDYAGYDLDNDGKGDVPYRPVKLFSYVVNKTPESMILLRSLFVEIINFSEKVSPIFTPINLIDKKPLMKKINDTNTGN